MSRGDSLHEKGTFAAGMNDHDKALPFFTDALALGVSNTARLHNELACSYQALGRMEEAIGHWKSAIAVRPAFPAAQSNLGLALRKGGDHAAALRHYRLALEAEPDYERALFNIGNLMSDAGDFDGALAHYQRIVDRGDHVRPEVFNNIGVTLILAGRQEEAITHCNEALCSTPGVADANYNIAMALLGLGRMREGWAQHEWRWHTTPPKSLPRSFPQPVWDGSRVPSLMVHAEQGAGDCIQFARYLPVLAKMVDHVHFLSPPSLNDLFRSSFPGVENISYTDATVGEALPKFSHQIPMYSVARILGTDMSSIPSPGGYLFPEPERVRDWRQRVAEPGMGDLRIGLCWAGDPDHKSDHRRSIPTESIARLGNLPGIRWVSLQKRDVGSPSEMDLLDVMPQVGDFSDTAAIIDSLALVITVDTSIAHLTGAMGKDVWLMNRFDSHWSWTEAYGRDDNAWYSSARVFRQPMPGDWPSVLDMIRRELLKFSGSYN